MMDVPEIITRRKLSLKKREAIKGGVDMRVQEDKKKKKETKRNKHRSVAVWMHHSLSPYLGASPGTEILDTRLLMPREEPLPENIDIPFCTFDPDPPVWLSARSGVPLSWRVTPRRGRSMGWSATKRGDGKQQ